MSVYKVEFLIEADSMEAALERVNKPLGELMSLEEIDPETGEVVEGIYPEDRSNENHD